LSGAWELWTAGSRLDIVPGMLVTAALWLPFAIWLGSCVYASRARSALVYPYLLWLTGSATFLPLTSTDYNLIYLPVASLAVWNPRDPAAVQVCTAATLLWYQPFSLGFSPEALLGLKLLSVATVGSLIRIRAAT
jgi:hypothetical protein